MSSHSPQGTPLPRRLAELFATYQAGCRALVDLVQQFRDYLVGVGNEELDPQVRARVGASDILQDAIVVLLGRLGNPLGVGPDPTEDDLRLYLRRVYLNALR